MMKKMAEKAVSLIEHQQYDEAESILFELDPYLKHPVLLYFIGWSKLEREDYDQSEYYYNKSLKIDNMSHEPHIGLGHIAFINYDYNKAIEHYNQAINLLIKNPYQFNDQLYLDELIIKIKNDIESCNRALGSNRIKIYDYYTELLKQHKLNFRNTNDHSKLIIDLTQGIGEQIMAFRFLDFLNGFDQVDVLCDDKLVPLFQRCNSRFNYIPRSKSHKLNHSCIMTGFDLIEQVAPTIDKLEKTSLPLLSPKKDLQDKFLKRFGSPIGVTWASPNSHDRLKHKKSFDPTYLNQLKDTLTNDKFISLQYGEVNDSAPKFIDQRKDVDVYDNIENLFALISICKCVIGSSNSAQSVAGAMGIQSYNFVHSGQGKTLMWEFQKNMKSMLFPSVTVIETPGGKSNWDFCFDELKKYI